ncbi:agmatine deiminase family protein [Ancylomarina sp. YFZ004]
MMYISLMVLTVLTSCSKDEVHNTEPRLEAQYSFPEESEAHEGTWLQWPHHYQYGIDFRKDLDATWVAITKELATSENVHIVAYNETEKNRIIELLKLDEIPLEKIDFKIYQTDDFWTRDNGPIYVRDKDGKLLIQDWGFNGWGEKTDFKKCNTIPSKIAKDQGVPVLDLNEIMINEGGSVEADGHGTLMGCKSSILNSNRNPGMSQKEAEEIFTKYYGVTNFIWLDGQAGLDITDQHVDGFARFANSSTIITMNKNDLKYYDVKQSDINKLYAATNKNGEAYEFLIVPLSQNDVMTTYGKNVGKGSYCNYYIANTKVLVPIYKDPNDQLALEIIQSIYPNRKVVGIDCRNLYANGGMIHCVTQQQPKE